MKFKYTNNLSTNLYETISNRDEVIKIQKLPAGINWPSLDNDDEVVPLTLVDLQSRAWEIVYVHQITLGDPYDTVTVTRAHEGTGAAPFSKGAVVENRITADFLNHIEADVTKIPLATHDVAGIVKVGDSIDVTDDGTINFNKIATTSDLGLVKIGNGLILSSDGTISTDGEDLPVAPLTYYEVTFEATQDLIAPYTLEIPDDFTYVVGNNTLEISVEGSLWYRGKQFQEIGTSGTSNNQIAILGNIASGEQINIRVPNANAIKGAQGDKGDEGPQGPKGDTGETGPQGPAGDDADISNCVLLTTDQAISGVKTFSSSPLAPTPADSDNSTKLATTAWVTSKLSLFDAIPSGIISMWSGATNTIPSGWYLCDGNNNTPDLRDKFIVGAGLSYTVGSTGGSTDVSISGTIGATTLSTSQIPSHQHPKNSLGVAERDLIVSSGKYGLYEPSNGIDSTRSASYGGYAGGSSSHTHSASLTGSGAAIPPYYALCYIMKG